MIAGRQRRLSIDSFQIAAFALMLSGCAAEPSSTDLETLEPLVLHNDSFVDSFLLTEDGSRRWRFTPDQFIVEAFRKPLPKELVGSLVVADAPDLVATFRISGDWKLLDNGHTLRLTDIDADQATGRPDVRLEIETTGPDSLTISGFPYRLAPSLPLREILPNRIYTARIDEVIRGDILRVKEKQDLRSVKLEGIICPGASQPFGEEAIRRCAELLGDGSVFVKVFQVDEQGRDVAQVWGPNYRYVNLELLNAGLAWHDKRHSDEWILATAEDDARTESRGLWADPDPTPPWEWDRQDEAE